MSTPLPIPTHVPADLAPAVAAHLDHLAVTHGARALVLGPKVKTWADLLSARRFDVTVHEDPLSRSPLRDRVDVVLAIDVLARVDSYRWVLQQAHASLSDQGHLILAVPNALALGSSGNLRWLTSRVMQRLGAPFPHAHPERRYRLSSVVEVLEVLGFSLEQVTAHGVGWLGPLARVAPRLVQAAAHTYLLRCARLPSLFGVDARRPYPDPVMHRRRHEARHRRFVAARDRWLDRHPRPPNAQIERFEPHRYRGAQVLVLSPHPDDEIIGCGGTLAKLVAHGARVTVVHATDGSATDGLAEVPPEVRRTVRLEEARAVAALMMFTSVECWGEDDMTFAERDDLIERLRGTLCALRPDLIFAPFVTDDHPAHRAMARMLARALRDLRQPLAEDTRVLAYEIWNLAPATACSDITDVVGMQEQALQRYATAMRAVDYVHSCQDRNYYNACVWGGFRGFAEIFVAVPARDFPALLTNDFGT